MAAVRPRYWVAAIAMAWTLACSFSSDHTPVVDTDQFAADPMVGADEPPPGPGGHLPSDLRGIWVAEIRSSDQRRLDVLAAGRDGALLETLDPPLTASEQAWFVEVADHLSAQYHWWYCATHCRVEIRDSGIWIEGFLIYDRLGSALVKTRIEGRDVYYELKEHVPDGRNGIVHIRMNREWTGFRIIHIELEHFEIQHIDDLLQLRYYRRTPELR